MATQKPVEWVTSLITRFEEQVSVYMSLGNVAVHVKLFKTERASDGSSY